MSEPRWTGEVAFDAVDLAWPLRKQKPLRIFVNSMSDLFHEKLTNEQIAAVVGVMAACPQHTFQILTKRAKRMREWFAWIGSQTSSGDGRGDTQAEICRAHAERLGNFRATDGSMPRGPGRALGGYDTRWPLPNVWIGVSIENQDTADERIPLLLATPAAVRFLSMEPLLELVQLPIVHVFGNAPRPPSVDWIICGCESGPGARPCAVEWLRSLRDQSVAAGVPFFLKQAVGLTTSRAVYPSAQAARVETVDVGAGDGSRRKASGVIELPYLDGVQWAQFPERPSSP